jgi:hypothetical protein
MRPLYLARIEDLGRGDLVKVDCAACQHVALLTPDFLLRLGLSRHAKVLDLKSRVRCRRCGARGRAVLSVKWGDRAGEPVTPTEAAATPQPSLALLDRVPISDRLDRISVPLGTRWWSAWAT